MKYIYNLIKDYLLLFNLLDHKIKKATLNSIRLIIIAAIIELLSFYSLRLLLNKISLTTTIENNVFILKKITGLIYSFPEIYYPTICILAFLFSAVIRIYIIKFYHKTTAEIAVNLSRITYKNILLKNYIWHLKQNPNKIKTNLTKDIEQIQISINAIFSIIVNLLIVSLLSVYLLIISPLIMFLCIFVFSTFYLFVFKKLRNEIKKNGDNRTINFNMILETLEGSSSCIKDIILDDNYEYIW